MPQLLIICLLLLSYGQLQADTSVPEIPQDVVLDISSGSTDWISFRQRAVNRHAWHTFIALMTPVRQDGLHREWETWKEQFEVYPEDGSEPAPWGSSFELPTACEVTTGQDIKYLHRDEKVDDVLDAVNQAVKVDATLPGSLKDQHQKVVRYEIRLNKTAFDYVVENKLYDAEQQIQKNQINYPNGSIIIKAAWRELTDATTKRHKFMRNQACICDNVEGELQNCHIADVALVGFHIMQKTPSAPQWIWSTFEQVANVESVGNLPASFNNPDCQGDYCTDNSQTPDYTPNQVTQVLPIEASLQRLNTIQQQHLATQAGYKVLANYQLMSAQWPLPKRPHDTTPETVFDVQPTFSANTTMETFAQESSSCMGCHVMSRTMRPDEYISGDFSFTINNAHPQPEEAICNKYSYSNSLSCSNELILFDKTKSTPGQQKGHDLVTNTYKMLPDNVGNRLNCSSCHLHAGGDPQAAWWVGLQGEGREYPTETDMQDRINQCFERSMNGTALCSGEACDSNADMSAIIAYMNWLTNQYKEKYQCLTLVSTPNSICNPPRGFPELTQTCLKGNPAQGEAIFDQKCAFCHGLEGEGRYASNTYFRPALWGDDSYNVSAGMAKPDMLAKFLRWNMPYTSGGLLTDQEAIDIACFIDQHARPGKAESGISNEHCLSVSQ
ncbi:c-type cytochrome [Candidatus Albibeggiatoa sp. nov. NOAA]|uniref:c-type cytochrome n=1 Tax=Candidatus Albibeggiatoa sp. nov. NOAA TaxID=3162724 RepID=UPI00330522A1|nr:c-type cytochrome [Thiotrichaceae bacterium]